MGGTDTMYHHELTEKLAWRKTQTQELWLHGIRNIFYALIFLGLATIQPDGIWAYAIITALCAEFLITLWDFVEEDLTRKLPVSERLLHTVLTANYGVVLALLIPVLWGWGQNPTGLEKAWHGYWSMFLIFGAVVVFILGLRDFHARARLQKLFTRPAKDRIERIETPITVLMTGGTGFIGRKLIPALKLEKSYFIRFSKKYKLQSQSRQLTYQEDLSECKNPDKI